MLLRCLPRAFAADGWSRTKCSLYLLLALLGVRDAALPRLEILRTSLTSYRKSEELWLVEENFGWQYDVLIVLLKKDVRQGGAEVAPVDAIRSASWNVHLLALRTENLDPVLAKLVTESIGHDALFVTEGARAIPVATLQIPSIDQCQTYYQQFKSSKC